MPQRSDQAGKAQRGVHRMRDGSFSMELRLVAVIGNLTILASIWWFWPRDVGARYLIPAALVALLAFNLAVLCGLRARLSRMAQGQRGGRWRDGEGL